jgi:exodeoxyribonuclease-5
MAKTSSGSGFLDWRTKMWMKRVDEMLQKEIINLDEHESLLTMLKSPDKENFTIVKRIMENFIKEKLAIGLNEGQTAAFNGMIDFLDNPVEDAVVLRGYAGTGKTFLVKRLIQYIGLTDERCMIACGAPTNKAVKVLFHSVGDAMQGYIFEDIFNSASKLTYSTIHKLLGMKERVTDDGEQIFLPDALNKSELSKYNYLIVDEVSMLDDKLCKDILKYSKHIRIIFMGDPAQIPPVNRADSIPFKANHGYNFKLVELSQIMRQKGDNPIVKASLELRNNLLMKQPIPKVVTELNSAGHGIIHLDPDQDKQKIRDILKQHFVCDEFDEDSDYMKAIAWKNSTVDYINHAVREMRYGKNPAKFLVGEKLVARKPIFEKVESEKMGWQDYWRVLFTTSEELEVLEISEKEIMINECQYKLNAQVYELVVSCYSPTEDRHFTTSMDVIHEKSLAAYNALIDKARVNAINSKKAAEWICFYNLQKWTADVSYGYAITAHKSQGSTYKYVMIFENDIDANHKTLERNRIKYTSYSRATDAVYVVRKN